MTDFLSLLINISPLLLLLIGLFVGRYLENKHYASIIRREKEMMKLPAVSMRQLPPLSHAHTMLVSVDYFKKFLASLRNLFGGRVTAYESLLDRARRESTLRMKEHAKSLGASLILNTKIETSSMYKGRRNTVHSVEVIVYGTAVIVNRP
ncbi:MAG: heavy metal-binding domain-containing protein [Mariprofundaceae bacterium]|nr:heavy metal-binding domain-containing protein [Mariprofundaceae bacterium]